MHTPEKLEVIASKWLTDEHPCCWCATPTEKKVRYAYPGAVLVLTDCGGHGDEIEKWATKGFMKLEARQAAHEEVSDDA